MNNFQREISEEAVLKAADQIAALLCERTQTDLNGWDFPESITGQIVESGLLQILQPRVFGGLELNFETFFDVQARLARASMSAGWLVGVLGLQAWQLALFPIKAQEDVWSSKPQAPIASSFMPAGRVRQTSEGFVLSGHWHYASGCAFSDWAMLGAIVEDDTGTRQHCALLVPRSDFDIRYDWRTVGLRETGSHSVVVEEAFVPRHRSFRAADGFRCDCPGHAMHVNPLYKVPFGQVFALTISLPAVGALENAVQFCMAKFHAARAQGALDLRDTALRAVALAASSTHRCRTTATNNLKVLTAAAQAGEVPSVKERAFLRIDAAQIITKCVEAINELFRTQGLRSIATGKPLADAWLDINTAGLHAANNADRFANALGNVLTGHDISEPLI